MNPNTTDTDNHSAPALPTAMKPRTVILPPNVAGRDNETVSDISSIVVVGANGSGKSQLGLWIEKNNPTCEVHRITAQRALAIPIVVQPQPYDQARSRVHYGSFEPSWTQQQTKDNKIGQRFGDEPVGRLLTDFETLLALLFAEDSRRNREFKDAWRPDVPTAKPTPSKLDQVQLIWDQVLPHRTLIVGDDKIQAKTPTGSQYEGRMMSDGEKVALYLIGQALCAPLNSIVVIDEPEIHLHRAIQAPLWDQVERARTDCTFVYITHDLEFAATRSSARKVWLKSFDGTTWQWEFLERHPELPDALLFQLLGNRRPVLFVEGGDTSDDVALYRLLFPKHHVIPRQGCQKVAESVKAFRALNQLHNVSVDGLVDRDHRSEEEILAFRKRGIGLTDVAEVENLLCLEEALNAAATRLACPTKVPGAKQRVLSELRRDREAQALARATVEIQFRLAGFAPQDFSDAAKIDSDLQTHVANLNTAALFTKSRNVFDNILRDGDYRAALRFFNSKGIPASIAVEFNIKEDRYVEIVLDIVRQEPEGSVANAMRAAILTAAGSSL